MGFLKRFFKTRRRVLIFLIIIVGIILGYRYFASKKSGEIKTARVYRGDVREELVLSGEISADEYAKLTFPTSGKIAWVGVKEGDEIKKGQALTKLDTVVLNTTYQEARAALRATEATVEKVHDQVKDHAADETYTQKDTRTTAEVAKDQAYEAFVAAEYNLRNSTLTSPFAGIVTFLAHPFPNVNVLSTEVQVEVINSETIYYEVSADQTEVTDLAIGQKVKIILDSYPDETFDGIVSFIGFTPKTGEAGSVYKIKVIFTQGVSDLSKFRVGMSGDAKFVLSDKSDVLYVPPNFVKTDAKGKYVNLGKSNNKAYIETGLEGEDRIEIKGNLREGDIVYD